MSIIPGVQVSVVKEVVPPQLSPTGVLGLVGLTERAPEGGVGRASTWKRFIELFGPGSAHSMPEARQALQNGASQLVVVAIPADKGAAATAVLTRAGAPALVLTARATGTWADALRVKVKHRKQDDTIVALDLDLIRPDGSIESHKNLGVVASTDRGAAERGRTGEGDARRMCQVVGGPGAGLSVGRRALRRLA